MVGIVVVSHSHALARAATEIAREMLHGRDVRIALAAGLDEHTFGTDAVQVQEAIEKVDGEDGVLVLMDLGSALLSAELALDLVDPGVAARVRLCAAPLVEGLVAATVAAAGGATLAEVESEAVAALAGKQAHLHPGPAAGASSAVDEDHGDADARATFTVANRHGLHARPAARLAGEVRTLDARVQLRNLTTESPAVPGASLSRVATLGALRGHEIEVTATGSQAKEAVDHVLALAARQFDEADDDPGDDGSSAAHPGLSSGVAGGATAIGSGDGPYPASPGIAAGPAWTPGTSVIKLTAEDLAPAADPTAEWRRIRSALATVRRETVQTRARTARELGEFEAAVFDAHLMLMDDSELLDDVRRRVNDGASAPHAWSTTVKAVAEDLSALTDEYLRARAEDVRAVHDQVLLALLGRSSAFEPRPGVLVAADLTPAQAALLDRDVVSGIVLAYGSPTSHSAILARSRGIPAVVGAGAQVLATPEDTIVALDGETGQLVVDPDAETLIEFKSRAADRELRLDEAMAAAAQPALTRDGTEIHVAGNVGCVADAVAATDHGADLAGLIRTEFLFLGRDSAPSVDEQEEAYRAVVTALSGRRAIIRTLDVGGDKPLPYVDQPIEANPFLGVRGLRLALARPELLRDQLRAICRVAADHPVSIMFPMVSAVDELLAARRILDEVLAEAGGGTEGTRPDDLEVGIMIEVPSAALKAAIFVPHVDFFSIGTNDLTQYTLAAERGNDALSTLADPLDPGVLRLIDSVCRAAASTDTRVAVCGEVASDPVAAPLLLGLGVDELSVGPYAVPVVKQAVRQLDLRHCQDLAARALDSVSAADVRSMITG
ncbi:phosphoenolpyruvate--protein phosphotransferase [Phytoactinopolyspora alkaliphila]|uniref:Phosphocarrier protein HPr n=1 Tax=Phytoactinopolyspora alkaliphila TaxID=1783498 RepID=A0A6N9YML7_9ACTN|nr:phosphoenolpyruvate--protein phosphotransferase [Phytoactinopolyspora alkaliphila]NED96233.1 phosphoenolpyruvate--protein phosphotransferase [Phytoactinopolyspora alkaliphila]